MLQVHNKIKTDLEGLEEYTIGKKVYDTKSCDEEAKEDTYFNRQIDAISV